ncbi:transcriptional regulator [Orrella marina]|uniref:Transcriptional regulator n=2 Tax=Orrella marina TaxID=2163011 RepID=A0A2R4XPR9_9BURK|nr:transcriptional regulator [Orrella marina]
MAQAAEQAALFLRMLGNEQRLHVLCLLLEHQELSVSQLLDHVPLSQSALSQHLAKMREEGLVNTRRVSQMIFYRIGDSKVERIIEVLKEMYCP